MTTILLCYLAIYLLLLLEEHMDIHYSDELEYKELESLTDELNNVDMLGDTDGSD